MVAPVQPSVAPVKVVPPVGGNPKGDPHVQKLMMAALFGPNSPKYNSWLEQRAATGSPKQGTP